MSPNNPTDNKKFKILIVEDEGCVLILVEI